MTLFQYAFRQNTKSHQTSILQLPVLIPHTVPHVIRHTSFGDSTHFRNHGTRDTGPMNDEPILQYTNLEYVFFMIPPINFYFKNNKPLGVF